MGAEAPASPYSAPIGADSGRRTRGTRMAARASRAVCQIYLVMDVRPAALEQLAALLARGPIASVLFRPAAAGTLSAQSVKPLVEVAQKHGTAALLLDDAPLARTLRADGVHLSASADLIARYDDARSVLGSGAIVGADAGGSRHVAMELGEAGAEYVAFSADVSLASTPAEDSPEQEDGDSTEADPPMDQRALVTWWSDVFEVPCVAFDVTTADNARAMAAAGADFVAAAPPNARSSADVVAWLDDLRAAMERADA